MNPAASSCIVRLAGGEVMKRLGVLAVLLCAGMLAGPLGAQTKIDAPGHIPTVTRLVKLFMDLEGTLTTGLREGNAAAVDTMLAEDFEMRVASMPGNPTPRAEWIKLSLGKPASHFRIEQMAVHDLGDVSTVSFLQAGVAPGGRREPARDIAIVDVWKRAGDSWKLAIRYAGPAGSRDFVIPGASREAPIAKRY
jgi:Domain of unknown function (DUF4440)